MGNKNVGMEQRYSAEFRGGGGGGGRGGENVTSTIDKILHGRKKTTAWSQKWSFELKFNASICVRGVSV